MSNILKGIINEAHYPEDPDEYAAMFGPKRRKPSPQEPDYEQEPEDPLQDYYRKQDKAQAQYKKEVNVQYINKEGVAPNGERYNSAFIVRAKTPYQGDNEIYKFNDAHWGAKKIVDTVKKKPDEEGEPYLTIVYYVDNHKHGYWKPWKDEPPISKGVQFSETMMNEGISQEELANTLCHRIEMRYPDIYQQYEYDDVYRAVDDVASFHAGAEELGSSDINIMIREVFKQLSSVHEAPLQNAVEGINNDGYGYKSLTTKQIDMLIKSGNWEAMSDIIPGRHLQLRDTRTGKTTTVHVKMGVPMGESEKAQHPYHAGYDAHGNNKSRQHNPYKEGTEAAAQWARGWEHASDSKPRVKFTNSNQSTTEALSELSTQKLAQYKTAAGADARKADSEGDYERGNKRFSGIVKATKKQFDNETKPKRESAIMKGLVDENLGTPYPGTYEQEYGPFKRKGQERTMKIAFEGKTNVSRRT